jgi:hypothetical protein
MTASFDRKPQLGADAVVRRDEQGISVSRSLQIEEYAEPSKVGICTWSRRRTRQGTNPPDQGISGID